MENFILKTYGGNSFTSVSEQAKKIAIDKNCIVEFDFNGCKCLVSKETNLEWLYTDYNNHWIMEWNTVGPNCIEEYPHDVRVELKKRTHANKIKRELEEKEYDLKMKKEREVFNQKVIGFEIKLKDEQKWNTAKSINTDAYGSCIFEYAEGWARLMQREIFTSGKTISSCAKETSHSLGFLGITGYMYGAAVSILSECWLWGEHLRQWHNKEYNHTGDGVVNPAVLSISTP